MTKIAIVTKLLPPTNHLGSRIKATLPSGRSVTVDYDHGLKNQTNHKQAAEECFKKHMLDTTHPSYRFTSFWCDEIYEIAGNCRGYVCLVTKEVKI